MRQMGQPAPGIGVAPPGQALHTASGPDACTGRTTDWAGHPPSPPGHISLNINFRLKVCSDELDARQSR